MIKKTKEMGETISKLLTSLLLTIKTYWSPYLKTIQLFASSDLRKQSDYIEITRGVCRFAMIRLSFFPYFYSDTGFTLQRRVRSSLLMYLINMAICCINTAPEFLWYLNGTKEPSWKKIMNFYYLKLNIMTTFIATVLYFRATEFKSLLTFPFVMEKEALTMYSRSALGGVRFDIVTILLLSYSSYICFPAVYGFANIFVPCYPFLPISLVTECTSEWDVIDGMSPSWVTTVFFTLVGLYFWYMLVGIYFGFAWTLVLYPGIAVTTKIKVISIELDHGNEEAIIGYREVQLLGIITNECWRFPLLQMLFAVWLVAEVIFLYICVRLYNLLPVGLMFIFAWSAVNGACLINVLFRLLASPCIQSQELFQKQSRMPNGGSKWYRRFNKSCAPYQLKIASGRYFDKTTPFVVWQFVVDRLVNCLLLK